MKYFLDHFLILLSYGCGSTIAGQISDRPQNQYYSFRNSQGKETLKLPSMGAGAIGCYFGGRLAQAGFDVSFIALGTHLAAILENGLKVLSPLGDSNIHPELYPSLLDFLFMRL